MELFGKGVGKSPNTFKSENMSYIITENAQQILVITDFGFFILNVLIPAFSYFFLAIIFLDKKFY